VVVLLRVDPTIAAVPDRKAGVSKNSLP
jgi:hypothetical protein